MIDSSLFGITLPAGTYSVGDVVQLNLKDGPGVVRSGRGSAMLKRAVGGFLSEKSTGLTFWKIHVKNSDWIDDIQVLTTSLGDATTLDQHSGAVRIGNNTDLTPNSSWEVWAECIMGGTTTTANSLFALIDIDYPQVSSIIDPDALKGIPASLDYTFSSGNIVAPDINAATWQTVNIDILKAGYQYALQEIATFTGSTGGGPRGFVKISNAAGMGGLSRIVPVSSAPAAIKQTIQYASLLVKGPMDLSVMLFNDTTATTTILVLLDFVKRRM